MLLLNQKEQTYVLVFVRKKTTGLVVKKIKDTIHFQHLGILVAEADGKNNTGIFRQA